MDKTDIFMLTALILTLAASGIHNIRDATAGVDPMTIRASSPPPIQDSPTPSERLAVIENNYKHMRTSFLELRTEFRRETAEIKDILNAQNDEIEKYILWAIGLLIVGDRGLAATKRFREVKTK